jgi:formamidopyrimidine-DNA glycosylase
MNTPELPELEILRRDLDKDIGGKKIKTVALTSPGLYKRGGTKKHEIGLLEGAKIKNVTRKGTWLLAALDNEHTLMISLGLGSQLRRAPNKDETPKGVVATIGFTQTGQMWLIDPKKNAEMFVMPDEEVAGVIGNLGLDLVDEPVSWTKFGEMVLRRNAKLKTALMDSHVLVGLGPVYSDEILFEAGLRYDRMPETLSTQEIRRLYRAAVEIVHDAVKHGGATIGADGFHTLSGEVGGYSILIRVFGRDGEMSPRARGPIAKARFGSGNTYFCEQTQV